MPLHPRRSALPALAIALAGLGAQLPGFAVSVDPPGFDTLVDQAREIFVGEVVSRQSRFVQSREGPLIVTLVTFRIQDSIKGGLQTETTIEFLGGTVGNVTLDVPEMPEFRVGDRDLLFVGNRNAVSPLIGFYYGRFRLVRDPALGVDTVRWYNGQPLASTSALTRAPLLSLQPIRSMTLADFRSAIAARVRAQGAR